jgi:hypothetical protein
MRAIPPITKEEIFRKYLEGLPTTEIAKLCGVSVGIVSSIAKEESRKDNNFFRIREITKIFYKNNLKILDVIAGIRLYNKIKAVGLDISFFENFIESTDTESFRIKRDLDKFLEDIKRTIQFEEKYQIKIEDIPGYIDNMIKQYNDLNEKKEKIVNGIPKLYLQHDVKKSEVEEYLKEKPSFLQYKRNKATRPKYQEWIVSETLFDEASKKIGTKIDPKILYSKLKWVYLLPDKHTSIIKKVMAIDENNLLGIKK